MHVKDAMKNSFFGVMGQIVLIVVGFFCQRTMNLLMGAELVGMNGVISNVIALLSVSELGIATAVVYNLYSAIARQDKEEIAGLMNLYRKAYVVFALVIFGLGLLAMPFVHLLMKNVSYAPDYIRLVFFLWLARTALSYLLSYKRSVLIADQKEYVVSIAALIVNVVNYSSTILILELTRSYVPALGLNIAVEAAGNLWIAGYVNRKYPFLREMRDRPLDRGIVEKMADNIKNIFVTRLFSRLLLSTDNLIISRFISTLVAGLYNNYCLVTQSLINIMVSLAGALKPTLGHLFLSEDKEKDTRALRQITFLFFMIVSTVSVCVFCLITPFVRDIWLNEDFLMGMGFVTASVAQFFFTVMGLPLEAVMSVTGLFDRERNVSVLTAVVNLAVSLALVRPLGIVGVIFGTIAAYLVQIGFRVGIFFRKYVQTSCVPYLWDLTQYLFLTCMEVAGIYQVFIRLYRRDSFMSFLLTAAVCALLSVMINVIVYFKSSRFRYILNKVREMLAQGRKGGKEV